eukprot:1932450-Rhodomonas_salina.9
MSVMPYCISKRPFLKRPFSNTPNYVSTPPFPKQSVMPRYVSESPIEEDPIIRQGRYTVSSMSVPAMA